MSGHNVDCPKYYGEITFLSTSTGVICPVSGANKCVECDVPPKDKLEFDDTYHFKKDDTYHFKKHEKK